MADYDQELEDALEVLASLQTAVGTVAGELDLIKQHLETALAEPAPQPEPEPEPATPEAQASFGPTVAAATTTLAFADVPGLPAAIRGPGTFVVALAAERTSPLTVEVAVLATAGNAVPMVHLPPAQNQGNTLDVLHQSIAGDQVVTAIQFTTSPAAQVMGHVLWVPEVVGAPAAAVSDARDATADASVALTGLPAGAVVYQAVTDNWKNGYSSSAMAELADLSAISLGMAVFRQAGVSAGDFNTQVVRESAVGRMCVVAVAFPG